MADNTVWSPRSPNIPNGQIKIANPPEGATRNNIQTDWVRINPNSANPAVQNLEYRVNNLNVVEFRYPTTSDPNGPKTTASSIQEVADDRLYVAAYGYTPTTTELVKDSLKRQLTTQAESIGWTSSITAPPTPSGDPQGGNAPAALALPSTEQATSKELNLLPQEIGLQAAQLKIVKNSRLQYPLQMSGEQDKIKFTAVKIKPRTQSDSGAGLGFEFAKPEYEKVDGPVFLAIQAPIADQNSVDWGPDSVNAIDAALYKASYGFIEDTLDKVTEEINKLSKEIYNTVAGPQRERIKRALAGQAAGINNVLARTDNAVLNPNLELLFQGPQLRPFTFTFKMSAREPNEAKEIKTIIKYFKYHMAVRQEKDRLFLRAPHVFTIQYMKGESPQHPGINLISPNDTTKACALTNCSVDYTPLGSYATYEDGTMVAYTLSLQFQEITPIYDTDYTDSQPIGF